MKIDAAVSQGEVHDGSDNLVMLAARVAALEEALAKLSDEVAVMKAVEARRDSILDRYPLAHQSSLSRSVRIEAQEFLTAGSGFYQLEYGANNVAYRWTGPTPESRIVVWVDRRFPLLLRFSCHNFGRSRFIRINVDDQEFEVARHEGSHAVQVGPIMPRGQAGPTEIRITPEVMFSPERPGHPDKRNLGVTFVWLELEPTDDPVGAKLPGTNTPTQERPGA